MICPEPYAFGIVERAVTIDQVMYPLQKASFVKWVKGLIEMKGMRWVEKVMGMEMEML